MHTSTAVEAGEEPLTRLCIVGGSLSHVGGLESFCERALDAFALHAPHIETILHRTEAAYTRKQGVRGILRNAAKLVAIRRDFDLAWVQVSCLPEFIYVVLARALGWTVLVTPHFGNSSWLESNRFIRWLRLAMMGRGHAVGLLFAEQEQEITLPRKLPRHVIGTFLPAHAFAARTDEVDGTVAPLRLIHAARFSAAKGTLLMLDLCARLKAHGIAFSARLVGRGDEAVTSEIARRIADAGMAQDVTLTDWLDPDGIGRVLRESDVLVHLSSIDSYPLIVLEALASDTLPIVRPMIGSRSMVRALGGQCVGQLGSAQDEAAHAVAQAFDWLATCDLQALRQEGRKAGRRTRAAYGWGEIVAATCRALVGAQAARSSRCK